MWLRHVLGDLQHRPDVHITHPSRILSCSVTLGEKGGNPFLERQFLVGQPPNKKGKRVPLNNYEDCMPKSHTHTPPRVAGAKCLLQPKKHSVETHVRDAWEPNSKSNAPTWRLDTSKAKPLALGTGFEALATPPWETQILAET